MNTTSTSSTTTTIFILLSFFLLIYHLPLPPPLLLLLSPPLLHCNYSTTAIISVLFFGGFPHFETHLGSFPGHDETHWPKCLELNHKCRCVKCPGHLWTQNGPIRVPTGTDEVSTWGEGEISRWQICTLMRHGYPLFSWDCVSGSSQRCESSSRRAMKLSHKLRGGDVYELLTEESPDIADRKWMNQWTNEANAFQRCVGVIWLMTSLQCWNMLILLQ